MSKKILALVALLLTTSIFGSTSNIETRNQDTEELVAAETTLQMQRRLLSKAYSIAKDNGHKNPELVQAVLLQETMAGAHPKYRVTNPGQNAYFGLMQIKLGAAKEVLKRWPSLFEKYGFHTRTDDEIKANLILNEEFNIEVGSKYLLMLNRVYGFTGTKLLNAYNRGPTGVLTVDDDFYYAIEARKKLTRFSR